MHVIETILALTEALGPYRKKGNSIGFVPTMGALHEGHLSLMRKCKTSSNVSVASIYVNPTQFNDKNDLHKYPRNLDRDCELLNKEGCDFIFAPTDREMYPKPDTRIFNFGSMGDVMEGKYRPGHFNGVAQIVTRLFDAVEPDNAYFGQKDFQQLAIIRKLVSDLGYRINIVSCPIIRESDGLAMSSRNILLSEKERESAPLIYQTLLNVKEQFADISVSEIEKLVQSNINSSSYLTLEYFRIVNANTLQPVTEIQSEIPFTACIAVFAGKVRLIDNVELIS